MAKTVVILPFVSSKRIFGLRESKMSSIFNSLYLAVEYDEDINYSIVNSMVSIFHEPLAIAAWRL